MKVLILHLSDIHALTISKTNETSKGSFLSHAEGVSAAVRQDTLDVRHVFLVVSGDLANTGSAAEYLRVHEFLTTVTSEIRASLKDIGISIVVVPGNHDCDFSGDQDVRNIVLSSLKEEPQEAILEVCLEPQKHYREFVLHLRETEDVHAVSGLTLETLIDVDGQPVRFVLINSACFSRREERPGSFHMPMAELESFAKQDVNPTVSVLHHPFNWFCPEDARRLRAYLESSSDIILTGHEHVADSFLQVRASGEHNVYLEGGVFQDHQDRSKSQFNIAWLDPESRGFEVLKFTWDDSHYRPSENRFIQESIRQRQSTRHGFEETEQMEVHLQEIGADINHPRKPTLILGDLFVYPDLEQVDRAAPAGRVVKIRGHEAFDLIQAKERILITGNEKAGKTSLAKRLFLDFREIGTIPLLLDDSLKVTKPAEYKGCCSRAYSLQYHSPPEYRYWQLERRRRVLIIDDFDLIHWGQWNDRDFLIQVEEMFGVVVVISGADFGIEELLGKRSEVSRLLSYQHLRILEMGKANRYQLARNWCRIGCDQDTTAEHVSSEAWEKQHAITQLLGRNLLPSLPLFVTIMLQQLDQHGATSRSSGSYGHLYESIIKASLARVSPTTGELDANINYLSHLAYRLFTHPEDWFSQDEMRIWHEEYCNEFSREADFEATLTRFESASMVTIDEDCIRFRYRYCYSFFVARFLADNIGVIEGAMGKISGMARSLHLEASASIMIFLCHLSKDRQIVDQLLSEASSLFPDIDECDLGREPEMLPAGSMIKKRLRLSQGTAEKHRERELSASDDLDHRMKNDGASVEVEFQTDGPELDSMLSFINQMNASFKTVQIMGQIIRNFYGSMRREQQDELMKASYSLGLRTLSAIYQFLGAHMDDLVTGIAAVIAERHGGADENEQERQVFRFLYGLSEALAFSTIQTVSNSVGLEVLAPAFERAVEEDATIAHRIIDLSVRLDHFKKFPMSRVETLMKDGKRNPFGYELVRRLIWRHFHLFDRPYKNVQSVCAKLDIQMPKERALTK